MIEGTRSGLRPMSMDDLALVLGWRNHPDVRRNMFSQHEISPDEHRLWFSTASRDPKRHLLLFEMDSTPLGFINLHEIAGGGIADWGFYVAPGAPKGSGRALGRAGIGYAFVEAKLYKLIGQALAFNERSIRFHLDLGFQREGVLRQQHFDGRQYHDIVCFGLLANEWVKPS